MKLTTKKAEQPCPKCASGDTWCLEAISELTSRDFFKCQVCRHIWSIQRAPAEPPC
jgi:hypothetical protein